MNVLALLLIIGTKEPKVTPNDIEVALLSTLDQHFWDAKNSRWREMVGSDDEVFLWGYSVLLSTFAIGAKVDPSVYKPRLEQAFADLEKYWTKKSPGGYAVLPGQDKNPDRYYDDNAWVGLAAMEAFDATKDKKYLAVAKRAFQFVKSGEDKKLGGGIYWHEKKKESKNACVSGPAACLAFRLYRVTKVESTLKDANNWLDWTRKLVDPADGLVMDNINVTGKVERTKWTYNSAMFAQALLRWHDQRNPYGFAEPENLSGLVQLLQIVQSSSEKWIDQTNEQIKNPGMFSTHLIETLTMVSNKFKLGQSTSDFEKPLEFERLVASIYEKCRNKEGLFGEYWDRRPKPNESLKLMYTASLLRTCLVIRNKTN